MSAESARAGLLGQLDAVGSPQSAVNFQRALASDLISAENDAGDDARWHAHLLRLMGDALAWKFLSRGVIRELARDRRTPAHLAGQQQDFEFVLDVADVVAHAGVVPVVCDLSHLLGVGDVIAATPSVIQIIECKNTPLPAEWAPRGRHWRQLLRQARASRYLASGHTPQGEEQRIAIEGPEPEHCYEELQVCVERARASERGVAITQLGERDILAAMWDRGLKSADALGDAFAAISNEGWQHPVFGGSATAAGSPGPFMANPYVLPLPSDARLAIADGDLLLFRLADVASLAWQDHPAGEQASIEIYAKDGGPHLRAQVDGQPRGLSDRFIEQIVYDFRSVADTRAQLKAAVEAARRFESIPEHERLQMASPQIAAISSFAYRNPAGSPEPVLAIELREFGSDRFVWPHCDGLIWPRLPRAGAL